MPSIAVHTIDARGNVLLEVMADYLQLEPQAVFEEIQALVAATSEALGSKGIDYASLRSALVPQQDRREIAFVFDTAQIDRLFYGRAVAEQLLPLFGKGSNHSVLEGDYIELGRSQESLYELLAENLVPAKEPPSRDTTFRHSSQFFLVYINNLTDAMVEQFHKRLSCYRPYIGYVDCTFGSAFKVHLSASLPARYLVHKRVIIMGHEDDVDNSGDWNVIGYPFEEHGFTVRSIQGMYYGVLLSYKIERPVLVGMERDTDFALNAVTPSPLRFDDFRVILDEAKLGYLVREKSASLQRSELSGLSREDFEARIRERLASNYIYHLRYNKEHHTMLFNIMIEFTSESTGRPQKLVVALQYLPETRDLRVVTMM